MPFSASPGIGNVRATEPGATTMMSYEISTGSPAFGMNVTTRRACSMRVTRPFKICARGRTRRSGTTTCRGSRLPAAASGKNGWYVMYDNGSMTDTIASSRRNFFCSRNAVYMPT